MHFNTVKGSIEKLLTAKHEQETEPKIIYLVGEMSGWMGFFPTGFCKRIIFTVFYWSRSLDKIRIVVYEKQYFAVKELMAKFEKYYGWTSQQWICVIEDFDLVTKRWLATDACTCINHRKLRSRLASLSAGSSDEITKFKSVFWRIALCRHPANTPSECFALRDFSLLIWLEVLI